MLALAVLLVAGFTTNAAVAWYVLWKDHSGSRLILHEYSREVLTVDPGQTVEWEMGFTHGRGTLRLWSDHDTTSREVGGYKEFYLGMRPQDVILAEVPRWAEPYLFARDSAGTPMPLRDVGRREIVAAGFPMLSLYAVIHGDIYTDDFEVRSGIALEYSAGMYGDSGNFIVPYRPLVVGLIVNTVFWALPWSVLLAVALGGRRLWRYERGRCPRCAYDLRRQIVDGCPECGWRRTDQSQNRSVQK